MEELSTKRKGIITEESLKLWFLKHGCSVSVPIGDNDRYDFIIDINGKLLKMQSKTSNLTRKEGYLNFKTCSERYNSQGNTRVKYSPQEIDYFCTMHPETGQVYIVPVEECGNEFYLRLIPLEQKNNRIHIAENYEGEKFLKRIKNS